MSKYPALTAELMKRGYNDADMKKILGLERPASDARSGEGIEAPAGRARPVNCHPQMIRFAAAIVLALVSAPAAAQSGVSSLRIQMERSACFGTCPVYSLEMQGNGTVTYIGREHVRVSGERTWTVDPDSVRALARDMEKAGFFEMKDAYAGRMTDLPTTYTTLTSGGRTKRIRDYFGAPPELKEIEARIDAVSGARGYVSISAAAVREMQQSGWRPIAENAENAARWMHRALASGDADTVTALLAAGMDARTRDADGVTFVMEAAVSGDAATVRAVLAAGGDPTARDRWGRNAADRARDGLASDATALFHTVEATGRPRDYALVLRLLTDE